jgi:hypothetical protein
MEKRQVGSRCQSGQPLATVGAYGAAVRRTPVRAGSLLRGRAGAYTGELLANGCA